MDAINRKRREEASKETGLLVVRCSLGADEDSKAPREEAFMCVDNASSLTILTREMVDVLGIGSFVGEEVELTLVNRIKLRAPQVLLPSASVDGCEAKYVKAVILDEMSPGISGILGLSFLSRFDFVVEKHKPQRLTLKGRTHDDDDAFDVFICHKSEDAEYGRAVYDLLVKADYRVFFSAAARGSGEFQQAIDKALETSTYMVVVTSSESHVLKPWVQTEWRMFDGMIRERRDGGKKRRSIVPVLCGSMERSSLPMALRRFEMVEFSQDGWGTKLLNLLRRG